MATDPDDLVAWIAELRARVARGDLDGQGEFEAGVGRFAVGLAARIMLADLDHYEVLPPTLRGDLAVVARREALLRDLRRLREQIG